MIIRYKVEYWDELDREIKTECGFAANGKTIGKIVDNIYEYYGKNNISSLKFYECEPIMCDEEVEQTLEDDI